jgi:hypothetical protein
MKLLTSQKNTLYEIIKNNVFFSHNQFELIEDEHMGESSTGMEYKDNKRFYFKFVDNDYYNSLIVNFSPDDEQVLGASSNIDWEQALTYFDNWLYFLKREVTAPNLWEKFKTEISEVKYYNDFSNQKFSFSEYEDIKQKIDLLKTNLSNIPLILSQQSEILSRLDHLSETAKELGKFDWINLFIGTIISIVIQLKVTPDNANALWDLIKRIFGNYFLIK